MEKIASFQVDHTRLRPGMYLSRVDGDVITYDLRFVRPNTPPYLEPASMHTLEHLFATYLRNSDGREGILYFGPMGCRTGFYLLTRGLAHGDAIRLVREALTFIAGFAGPIPGATAAECGNYREHDLDTAKRDAAKMIPILSQWDESLLAYEGP